MRSDEGPQPFFQVPARSACLGKAAGYDDEHRSAGGGTFFGSSDGCFGPQGDNGHIDRFGDGGD
jgi:hypothetical protein